MRYQGQGHEIEVTLPAHRRRRGAASTELGELFGAAYEQTYTLRLDEPVEIVNWKVEAIGPAPSLGDGYALRGAMAGGKALKGTRRAYDPGSGDLADWPRLRSLRAARPA